MDLRQLTKPELEDLDNRFGYHKPLNAQQVIGHEEIRQLCLELAESLSRYTVPSRELSLAVAAIEIAMFWANAAFSRIDQEGERRAAA